jgi:hypothetical protein
MKTTRTNEWLYFLTFALACVVVFSVVYYLFGNLFTPAFRQPEPYAAAYSQKTRQDLKRQMESGITSSPKPTEKIEIGINQKIRIGNAFIIYRGLEGRSQFKVDVVVPELDPQAFYPYVLNIGDARKGFRLRNRDFELKAVNEKGIVILLMPHGPK